jgi:hypothetical protein
MEDFVPLWKMSVSPRATNRGLPEWAKLLLLQDAIFYFDA